MEQNGPDIITPHGGYRKLRSFQCAQLVYDGTVVFCERFVERYSRTRDQMIQAARSGVQNIAEGSVSSATSKKTEIRLTSVARASIEELVLDYEDYLRQRRLEIWPKDSPEALAVRARFRLQSESTDPYEMKSANAKTAANTMICLANQASFLLGRQIVALERRFMEEGGFSERLHRARRACRR